MLALGAAQRTGQANLRHHLTAKGTLAQVRGDPFPAESTLPHFHGLMSDSAHEPPEMGLLVQAKGGLRQGQDRVMYMPITVRKRLESMSFLAVPRASSPGRKPQAKEFAPGAGRARACLLTDALPSRTYRKATCVKKH